MIEATLVILIVCIGTITYLLAANRKLKNGLLIATNKIKRQEKVIKNAQIAKKNYSTTMQLNDAELDNSLQSYYRD